VGRRQRWIILASVGALAVVVGLLLTRDRVDPAAPDGGGDGAVVLVGDSIGSEAAPYLEATLDGAPMVSHTYGGTAPCDWSVDRLDISRGDVVVLTFTGNSFTPCMEDGSGGHLHGEALVTKYANDLRSIVGRIRDLGADALLVGQPERGPRAIDADVVAGLNAAYQSLADELDGVSYVDAGAAVETDDGDFAADLPCLPDERECGPSGRIAVRNPDGVHLCPQAITLQCDVHSSGALRFARAIADAVDAG
jgi:hypothetical protein